MLTKPFKHARWDMTEKEKKIVFHHWVFNLKFKNLLFVPIDGEEEWYLTHNKIAKNMVHKQREYVS